MPFTKTFLLAAAATLFATTNAHMIMKTPTPFGKPTSSPLDKTGSDFPCKETVYDASGISNIMPIGVNQTLSFTGSAVHGGGSCQISLTTDKKPNKATKWMVIHSIEGSCPSSASGNLPEDPSGNGADKFQYSIPEGIEPGQYVLAWTWFNHIGDREMYMNCAPVTVTGGSGKRDTPRVEATELSGLSKRASSFPPMFVANIGNGCKTIEGKDTIFPEPGASVERLAKSPDDYIMPDGTCATGGSPSGSPIEGNAPPAASSGGSAAAQPSIGGVFNQGATIQISTSTAAPPVATVFASDIPTAVPTSSSTASAAPAASADSPSVSAATVTGTASCTTPGQGVCSPNGKMIG
ncbi:MAG: hypothetical protein Q9187_009182, partial [Circinaria calcarea]